jgi:hypothetical protein
LFSSGRRRTLHPLARLGFTAASLRHSVHFGIIGPRPPCPFRINRRHRTLRARPVMTGPTSSCLPPAPQCQVGRLDARSRAPLLRFSSPSTLAGRARAVRGGRPPDDPASTLGLPPARAARTCRRDFALAVFRCSGPIAMSLCGGRAARAFQSNPSFARSAGGYLYEASPLCLA